MTETTHKPLTCRLHVHHRWETKTTDDGARYQQCRRCGTDRTEVDGNGGDKSAAAGAIGVLGGGGF